MKKTYIINNEYFEKFKELIEQLNKKALKCGEDKIEYTIIETFYKDDKSKRINKFYNIEVEYEDIKIDGYKVIATICHNYEDGNVVRLSPTTKTVNEKYRTIDGICQHCNTNRRRKQTVLLENEQGEIIQVGKTCLKDFLGHNINDKIKYIENLDSFTLELNGFGGYCEVDKFLYTNRILEISNLLIKTFGYIKTRNEYGENVESSTKNMAFLLYNSDKPDRYWSEKLKEVFETLANEKYKDEEIEKMKEMIKNDNSNSEYISNLKVLSSNDFIEVKDLGFLVSLPVYYNRNIEKQNKTKGTEGSKWVGEPKQKMTLDVTLDKIKGFDTQYGYMKVYEFKDKQGNLLVWKTSKGLSDETIGNLKISFTIKEHMEFRGLKHTSIIRVKEVC